MLIQLGKSRKTCCFHIGGIIEKIPNEWNWDRCRCIFFSQANHFETAMPMGCVFKQNTSNIFFCQTLAISSDRSFFRTIFIPKKLRWKWEGSISSTGKHVFHNRLLQKPQHLLFKSFSFSTISPQTKIKSIFKPLFVGFSMTNESWLLIPPIIGSLKKDPSMQRKKTSWEKAHFQLPQDGFPKPVSSRVGPWLHL